MRRYSFWVGLLSAIATYVTLAAFVDRPWRWHHHRGHHYYHDRMHDQSNDSTTVNF